MQRRPIALSILCWFLIIYYLVSLLLAILLTSDPDKFLQMHHGFYKLSTDVIRYKVAMMFITPLVNIAAGFGMLYGRNWARYLFLIFNMLAFLIDLIIQHHRWHTLGLVVIFVVILYFLFNQRTEEFFNQSTDEEEFH